MFILHSELYSVSYLVDEGDLSVESISQACDNFDFVNLKLICNNQFIDTNYLYSKGFIFSDRSLCIDMDIVHDDTFMHGDRFEYISTDKWDCKSVFDIACNYFEDDPRFSIGRIFCDSKECSLKMKDELLWEYINII